MSFYQPRSEGDNVLGSVRPSFRLSVRQSVCPTSALPSAAKSKEESLSVQDFVCMLTNCMDAVDRFFTTGLYSVVTITQKEG